MAEALELERLRVDRGVTAECAGCSATSRAALEAALGGLLGRGGGARPAGWGAAAESVPGGGGRAVGAKEAGAEVELAPAQASTAW